MSKKMLRRLRTFLLLCASLLVILSTRLVQLQLWQHDYYYARAETNKIRVLNQVAPRGEILDRKGKVLATNRPGYTVSILDLDRKEAANVIKEMAKLLDMEEEEIYALIKEQRYRQYIPVRLKTDVDEKVIAEYYERKTELPGVIIEVQHLRHYPEGNLAAHVLGRTGAITAAQLAKWAEQGYTYGMGDIVGREGGIEEVWEPYLRGTDGQIRVEVDNLTQVRKVNARVDPIPGNNVYLTLDARLQRELENAMRNTMEKLNKEDPKKGLRGAAVALDPFSGAILAMVSLPDYDLNTFQYVELQKAPNQPLLNRVIAGRYPVGSTYKVLTTVAALEEGVLTPTRKLNSPSRLHVAGNLWKANYALASHGYIDVVTALKVSSNTFFYQVGTLLGPDKLEKWGRNFGMGSVTGLQDIRGEVTGSVSTKRRPGEVMDAAIGQGHAITPLQLAQLLAMIVNGGTQYRPYLVDRVVDPEGEILYQARPKVLNRLELSEVSLETVKKGMEAGSSAGGTSGRFRNFPYPVRIPGKTGTAQDPPREDHSLFISYAPGDDPEIVLAVIIENSGIGGAGAIPVAWDFYLSYFAPRFEETKNEQ
ncbi:MAG TPA: penicillin-binding protein 2 [Firmicutes bacterium]|nr:penicillin-binding protein 2 [Bacillota bacterium]